MQKVSLRDNNSLIFKDGVVNMAGVLFLHQENGGQQQFEYLLGNKNISQESVKAFSQNMRRNLRYTKINNIPYKHVIFPSKPYAFRHEFEKIGVSISRIGPDHLYNHEGVTSPELTINEYYLDDTHVNHRGLLRIISGLIGELIGIKLPKGNFIIEKSVGDLGKMYGINSTPKEKFSGFVNVNKNLDFIFTLQNALKGNTGHLDVNINTKALLDKRILVFGDSFFRASLPILNNIFEEVIYIRCPFIMQDLANALEPDIILSGNAERYLVNVPDSLETPPYFLNYFSSDFDSSSLDNNKVHILKCIFSGRNSKLYKQFKETLS